MQIFQTEFSLDACRSAMDSQSLPDAPADLQWHRFDVTSPGELPKTFGSTPCVYLLRLPSEPFGHLRGSSDILSIGSAAGRSGMMSRLRGYSRPGSSQHTNLRINKLLRSMDAEIAAIPHLHPRAFEQLLLELYYDDYLELPPFNRSGGLNTRGAPPE